MAYTVDKTEQLSEAHKRSRFGQKASLQRAGVPTRQHNVGVTKSSAKPKPAAVKKTAAKKPAAKKTAKKS